MREIAWVEARQILQRTKTERWFGTVYNMNLYRGCCHGCIYCDSRSACYGITQFDSVQVKRNALSLLQQELPKKRRKGVVGTGAMSDPYNPLERELLYTRGALELLQAHGFGVAIATKSNLITRDIDVLQRIAQHAPVICKMTVTTCDDALAQKLEPNVSRPSERFAAIRQLSEAGLFTGVLMMPVLPFLEDDEANICGIVQRAKHSGARFIYPAFGVTLRDNQRQWYLQQLERLFPGQGLAMKYRAQYASAYECITPRVRTLWPKFTQACRENKLYYRMGDIIRASQRPYQVEQLSMFET